MKRILFVGFVSLLMILTSACNADQTKKEESSARLEESATQPSRRAEKAGSDVQTKTEKDSEPESTEEIIDGIVWELDKNTWTLTIKGKGRMEDYSFLEKAPWGDYAKKIQKVIITNGITYIGQYAFSQHFLLEEVSLPESLTEIGDFAFLDCMYLENIEFPEELCSIGANAFRECQHLKIIEFPKNVSSIGEEAFALCYHLEKVTFSSDAKCGDGLFTRCEALEEVILPEVMTAIPIRMFAGCTALATVHMPKQAESIGQSAFLECKALEEIAIPSGITQIQSYLFYNCKKLSKVSLPSGLTEIGNDAFYGVSSHWDLYYAGTEDEWAAVEISEDNALNNATMHFSGEN